MPGKYQYQILRPFRPTDYNCPVIVLCNPLSSPPLDSAADGADNGGFVFCDRNRLDRNYRRCQQIDNTSFGLKTDRDVYGKRISYKNFVRFSCKFA